MVKEKNKVARPILTSEEKELIENMLLCSLLSEEEILITYYEDGYLLTNYMTVIDINPLHSSIICTDAFYNKMTIQFSKYNRRKIDLGDYLWSSIKENIKCKGIR